MSRWRANRYLKRDKEGKLAADKPPGQRKQLDKVAFKKLKAQVKKYKDWTLEQYAESSEETTGVGLKKSAIGKSFKYLGITRQRPFIR